VTARRRRVLVVSHVFPPLVGGGAPRMGQFARLLPEFGWDVTVLTANHDQAVALDHAAVEALAGRATIVESWSPLSAVVPRGHAVPRRGAKAAARRILRTAALSMLFPDRQVLWVPSAIAAGRKALREVEHDVVFATHGPASDLVIGRELARQFKLPLIVDFRDLWSTLPTPAFTTRVHRAAARRLERSMCRAASRIVAVAPRMAEELATVHGVDTARAVSITNGFDPEDVARVHDDRNGASRPFRLVYTGSVHSNYNFDPFWRVIQALAREGRITPETLRIEFVGNLAVSDLRSYGVEAFVDTQPFVPHDRVFDAFAPADALLMIETAGYYARYSYAAKVFDYLITGKPVVALVEADGYTWRLLEEAGVGYCADPADEAGIRRVLERVLEQKGAPPRAVDGNAPPYQAFNRSHLAGRLASVLDEVVATEPHGRW
jgi:glycosyltransferase involved in cell wall biosynthesis